MDSLTISLPESIRRLAEDGVSRGEYGSIDEYICELIRSDQRRQAEARLDALLLEGLDSGEPIEVTPEYWELKQRRMAERLGVPWNTP